MGKLSVLSENGVRFNWLYLLVIVYCCESNILEDNNADV